MTLPSLCDDAGNEVRLEFSGPHEAPEGVLLVWSRTATCGQVSTVAARASVLVARAFLLEALAVLPGTSFHATIRTGKRTYIGEASHMPQGMLRLARHRVRNGEVQLQVLELPSSAVEVEVMSEDAYKAHLEGLRDKAAAVKANADRRPSDTLRRHFLSVTRALNKAAVTWQCNGFRVRSDLVLRMVSRSGRGLPRLGARALPTTRPEVPVLCDTDGKIVGVLSDSAIDDGTFATAVATAEQVVVSAEEVDSRVGALLLHLSDLGFQCFQAARWCVHVEGVRLILRTSGSIDIEAPRRQVPLGLVSLVAELTGWPVQVIKAW